MPGAALIVRMWLSVLLVPTVVTVLVPWLLLGTPGASAIRRGLDGPGAVAALGGAAGVAALAVGVLLMLGGSLVVARTVRDFASVGRGTLAPWDPPRRLVVTGLHRHMRNPMMSGVVVILLGEALAFRSLDLLVWAGLFALMIAVHVPLIEEPGLRRRFGAHYDRYRQNVPRWLPRLRAWEPPAPNAGAGGR